MSWLAFSYSLSAQSGSTPRVTLWRRLKRLGVVSIAGGVYLLPKLDECLEAFQWVAQEIRQAGGEALVMHVEQFEGLEDAQVAGLFNRARGEDYAEVERQLAEFEARLGEDAISLQGTLERLQKQRVEIARTDYFHSPAGIQLSARLNQAAQRLAPEETAPSDILPVLPEEYRARRWVTRPRPHVDRLACIWLIRKFIDPEAVIRYADQPEPDEVPFDMPDARFGHVGNLCTFETMLRAFNLTVPALYPLAEIVHEVDLRDGRYLRPEVTGVDAVLRGWLAADFSDAKLEANGVALFEGLYAALSSNSG